MENDYCFKKFEKTCRWPQLVILAFHYTIWKNYYQFRRKITPALYKILAVQ